MKATALTPAAIYCRSSKDKAEIGLDTQRRELRAYAQANGLKVVAEFSDMEISGSLDETSRPGFRDLKVALDAPDRKWKVLVAVDTSRLARNPDIAYPFLHDCERHGVDVRYSKVALSDSDPAGEMALAVLRANDRYNSRMCAAKGRSGMETNIAKGFRAGGSAPMGYKLQHHETGAMRAGMPVRKSTLVLDQRPAKKVQAFLRQRAAGTPRGVSATAAGLNKTQGSLIAIERNALTYAGYTVWNQRRKHRPTKDEPVKTMIWRPRSEWIVSEKPTHPALITRDQAERILAGVDKFNPRPRGLTVRKPEDYLLTGLLFAPDGTVWQADGKFYRLGGKPSDEHPAWGKRILRTTVDELVLHQMARELQGKEFIAKVVQGAHAMADSIEDNPLALDQLLRSVEAKLKRVADAVAENGLSATLASKLKDLETERSRLLEERATVVERSKLKGALRAITAKQVEAMLEFAPTSPEADVAYVRRSLGALVRRVELDPTSRSVRLHYRVDLGGRAGKAAGGVKVASPRGFEPRLPP